MSEPIRLQMLPPSVNSLAVRVFLRAAELPFEEVNAWGSTRTAEFMARIPSSLTPAIESPELPRGAMWESCAIMAYLSNRHGLENLYPTDPARRGQIDCANFYQIATIYPLVARATYERLGFPCGPGEVGASPVDAASKAAARAACEEALQKPLEVMRSFFLDRTGFIGDGEGPSIADIRFAATLEFCHACDASLPAWALDYLARVEQALGAAYTEPAADVRGYLASRKGAEA